MKKENLTTNGALKYSLKALISNRSLPAEKKLKDKILSACGIHEKTLSSWLNIPADDKREIPSGQLKIIADILCVPMEELFNEVKKES